MISAQCGIRGLFGSRGLAILAVAGLSCLEAAGGRFSNIVSFGDSLSDTGNLYEASGRLYPPPPYFEGRVSNGIVWSEYLAQNLELGMDDYAYVGAMTGYENYLDGTVPFPLIGFADQVDYYLADLAGGSVGSRELFLVVVGANDFFDFLEREGDFPIPGGVENTVWGIRRLAAAGARHFVVANVPDLSTTPAFAELGPGEKAQLSWLCATYNGLLATALQTIEQENRCTIVVSDLYAGLNQIIAEPEFFGLSNVTVPAIIPGQDPAVSLFWDGVHPTTVGHRLLADLALDALLQRYVPGKAIGLDRNTPGWLRR